MWAVGATHATAVPRQNGVCAASPPLRNHSYTVVLRRLWLASRVRLLVGGRIPWRSPLGLMLSRHRTLLLS